VNRHQGEGLESVIKQYLKKTSGNKFDWISLFLTRLANKYGGVSFFEVTLGIKLSVAILKKGHIGVTNSKNLFSETSVHCQHKICSLNYISTSNSKILCIQS
jgi:hypothetical protein